MGPAAAECRHWLHGGTQSAYILAVYGFSIQQRFPEPRAFLVPGRSGARPWVSERLNACRAVAIDARFASIVVDAQRDGPGFVVQISLAATALPLAAEMVVAACAQSLQRSISLDALLT